MMVAAVVCEWISVLAAMAAAVVAAVVLRAVVRSDQPGDAMMLDDVTGMSLHADGTDVLATLRRQATPARWAVGLTILAAAADLARLILESIPSSWWPQAFSRSPRWAGPPWSSSAMRWHPGGEASIIMRDRWTGSTAICRGGVCRAVEATSKDI